MTGPKVTRASHCVASKNGSGEREIICRRVGYQLSSHIGTVEAARPLFLLPCRFLVESNPERTHPVPEFRYNPLRAGEMAEWLKAAVC